MTVCTHREGPPCARCRVRQSCIPVRYFKEEVRLVEAAEADARREAFEEAAQIVEGPVWCHECNTDLKIHYTGRANLLRARAAKEGSE